MALLTEQAEENLGDVVVFTLHAAAVEWAEETAAEAYEVCIENCHVAAVCLSEVGTEAPRSNAVSLWLSNIF